MMIPPRATRTTTTMPKKTRKWLAVAAVLTAFSAASLVGALALADEQRTTGAILDGLEREPAKRAVTVDQVKRAKDAMERAARMRSAGDETHARQADLLAREWAEAGEDLARAAEAEAKAAAARRGAIDAGAQADRERALLEEGIARNGRLRALLEQTTREKTEAPSRTAAAAARAEADGGAGTTKRPKAGPSDAGSDR
jgi:hypothetical protein